jgi:hypothetical protein
MINWIPPTVRAVDWDPHFPGHRRLYAHDGHGNRLEFLERIRD